jgi:type II secretory ATPase GspE/PulE/Tfp pilus assembly ATPase PilB-like protein
LSLLHELRTPIASETGLLRPEAEALRCVPAAFAFAHDVLAYAVDGPELLVAAPSADRPTMDRIRLLTGMHVRIRETRREVIRRYLHLAYPNADTASPSDAEISFPAIRIVDEIHQAAITARASDIHVEPSETGGAVRYRVDGRLRVMRSIDRKIYAQVVARIKILAGMDVADRRQPQDGRYTIEEAGRSVDARVSSITTVRGERIVVRLFDSRNVAPSLDSLGMDSDTLRCFRGLIHAAHGFVIVCGPTGSGKTTTLYAALSERRDESTNLCTIEDPVEMQLVGIAQVQVNTKAGMTFARALRAMLRADPDVIMVGEMRDPETARVAVSAALSGQLVFTTMHSYDAAHAIERLIDLEIPRHAIAAALSGIVAQRLLRRICSDCREGISCKTCDGEGYHGRCGIFECAEISSELREAIAAGLPQGTIAQLVERDARGSLARDARREVMAGRTTASEVRRVLGGVAL